MGLFKSAAEKEAAQARERKKEATLDAVREARLQHNASKNTREQKLGKRREATSRWD